MRIKDPALVKQTRSVLRLEAGDKIIVCDGNMHEAEALITNSTKELIELELGEIKKNDAEPERKVTLYIAQLKSDNLELAVEKTTECGVSEIIPIVSERTIKKSYKEERLQSIAKEAAEQSGRGMVPILRPGMEFKEAVQHAIHTAQHTLILHKDGPPIAQMTKPFGTTESIAIFIGPEGGWSTPEIVYAQKLSFEGGPISLASLGTGTLRAETAAIVSTYLTARN